LDASDRPKSNGTTCDWALCGDYWPAATRSRSPPLTTQTSARHRLRLTEFFCSVPSALGNSAPSNRRVRVLSASLTDHVPKFATNPCASALYSSGFTSARLEPIMALGRSPAAITCVYRPLAPRLRLPLGLTQNAGLVALGGTSHETNVQLPTSCSL